MINRVLFLILILGVSVGLQRANSQLIYFSDSFGQLQTVDISSGGCDVNLLGDLGITATDIAFHPNGNLYATDGMSLYQIDIGNLNVTFIGNHNSAGGDFINALVCDNDGVMFGADNRLYTLNINTGEATTLGNLTCSSAGDLAFNNGELYLACQGNDLLKVNVDNPADSEIVGEMQASTLFFGIVTFATECDDVQTFGTAGNGLYQIDVGDASTTFVCNLSGVSEVYGAGMETDFIASDCDYVIDLDDDDSSGALAFDFIKELDCGETTTRIADEDFDIIADGVVDSIVIDIAAGIVDGASEQLLLLEGQTDNLDIIGSGTSHLQLISTGNLTITDIAHVLENTLYTNIAVPYTPGERQVTVQLFAEDDNQSNVATAFIYLVAGEGFTIDIGMDTSLCEGETLILDATIEDALLYEWSDGSGASTLDVSSSGLYSVTVTDDCGETATDDILVTFVPPSGSIDFGPDLVLCPGESIVLDATLPDGTIYTWNNEFDEPIFTVTETGFYAVSVTVDCGIQTEDIYVEFQELSELDLLPEDTLLCEGEQIALDVSYPGALAYNWEDGSMEPQRTISEAGLYAVTIDFQCGEYVDDLYVTVNDYEFAIDLGPDTTFCFGDSVDLRPDTPYGMTYIWQDGSTDENLIVRETGNYEVTITDGCTTINDQVFLRMISCCNVFVPNAFSPDFDGLNDDFLTYSDCEFPDFELKVFSRWGGLVFQTNDQSQGWDGRIDGEAAQIGVYVWILKYNDGLEGQVISGDLTLVR